MSAHTKTRHCDGVALILVMWVVLILSLLISGFAFTMHVETSVASYSRKRLQAEMLARSGVELARRELIAHLLSPTNNTFDARNQEWATNDEWYVNHELGDGTINVQVTDEESKLPVNRASPEQLKRLVTLLGVDDSDIDIIVDSIEDWIDADDLVRLNGAEDEYYMSLSPPYHVKNAPVDRIEELLLVRGMTRDILYGTPATADEDAVPGLAEFITAHSSGRVNVNTAPPIVLKAMLGLGDSQLEAVLQHREGSDGILGTDDDQPFKSLDEFLALLGTLSQDVQARLQQSLTVQSEFFTVRATGQVGNVKRTIVTILHRNGASISTVSWEELPGASG